MKWILSHRPSPAMAVAIVALVIAAGGVAFATIPDSAGTIHGCYLGGSGNLRVVGSAADCRSNETPISWNQEGRPGPSSVTPLGDVTLARGESKVLFSEGPLTLTARCRTVTLDSGPAPYAYVVVSTTQDHTAFSGGYSQGNDGELQAGPPPDPAPPNGFVPPGTLRALFSGASYPPFTSHAFSVAAPDGTRLSGVLNLGINALGRADKCVFGGHVVVG
jgi:hypothetical protein